MPDYQLTLKARKDIETIADYSLEHFGVERARLYRDSLFGALNRIAAHP